MCIRDSIWTFVFQLNFGEINAIRAEQLKKSLVDQIGYVAESFAVCRKRRVSASVADEKKECLEFFDFETIMILDPAVQKQFIGSADAVKLNFNQLDRINF